MWEWECFLSIDSYSFYVLNILRQESRFLRSLRLHQKMRQWEKTFSRSIYRWLWCMKMLSVRRKKPYHPSKPLGTTHARFSALWKSGLTPHLISVNIPQQTLHRQGLIYKHKLPVWVSLVHISFWEWNVTCDGVAVSNPCRSPGCVESECQRMIWALKWETIWNIMQLFIISLLWVPI